MHHRQKLSITRKLRWFALVAAIVLRSPICHAQNDEYGSPIPVPQSPNAASFGEYGKIGVNGYQGTANICIPLFDLELCGKKFPVTLSYNSSGIKVAQEASWIGLGWNLNIGGCITRQVMGGNDFYREYLKYPYIDQQVTDYSVQELVEKGYNYSSQYLLTQGWQVPYPNIFGYDTQPDEFYFNFGGHCGAFFFEPKSQKSQQTIKPVIVNQEEWLDITFLLNKDAFVVRDIDGFRYYFGTKEYTKPNSYTSHGINGSLGKLTPPDASSLYTFGEDHSNVSAWMLDSIVAPNGEAIRFQYAQESILTPVQTSEIDLVRLDPVYESFPDKHRYTATYSNARIDQQRLIGITTPTLSVGFSTSPRKDLNSVDNSNAPRACNSILVKEENNILKRFGFYQSYFGNTSAFTTCRLKLDSIIIGQRNYIGQQTVGDYQIYNFTYNNGDYLPAKNSRQRDLWGFYNKSTAPDYWGGADSKSEGTNLPSMKVKSQNTYRTIFYGRNKKCNASCMQYGMLTDITYPTGGKTHFSYEPHSFEPMRTEIKEVKLVNNGYASVNYFEDPGDKSQLKVSSNTAQTIILSDTTEVLFDISYYMQYQITEPINANLVIQKKNTTGYYANVYNHSVMTNPETKTGSDRQTVLLPQGSYSVYWQCSNNINVPNDNNGQQSSGNSLSFLANISYNTSTKDSEIVSQGGGLRIKEQYDVDTEGKKYNHRKYSYEGGLHYVYPTFEFGPFFIDYLHTIGNNSCATVFATLYHGYSSEPLIALTPPFCSSPVGYDKVIEEFVGNGSIEYYYQNQRAVFFDDPLLYDSETQVPDSKCSLLHALGTLQKTRCYDNKEQILSETTFDYADTKNGSAEAIVSYITYSPTPIFNYVCINSHSFSPNIIFKKYKLDGFTHLLTGKTRKEFFNGKFVSRTTSYTYDEYLRPVEVTTNNSDGSVRTTQTEYLTNTNQRSLVSKQTVLTDGKEDFSRLTDYKYLRGGSFRVPSTTYRTENGVISSRIRSTEHNDVGDPLTIQLEEGMLLEYAWDKHRLTSHTQSGMLHYAFEHHPLFGLTKRVEPTGRTLEFSYNAIGQLYRTQENGQTLCTYDYKLRKGGDNVVTTQNWLSENGAQTMTTQQFYNGLGYPSRNV
ncbi:MAG: hypothetical protein J5808_07500, partial [Paludibacteraceae bacterium]|nr:hypothetical protein [Paludibacteraceae bacterium]